MSREETSSRPCFAFNARWNSNQTSPRRNTLGTILSARGQVEDALAQYKIAIGLKPDYADAHWNRALVRLLLGDYQRGWADYEWRWQCKKAFHLPAFSQPRWDGGALAGKTILLYAEQGLGDTLHFVRYAPRVKSYGAIRHAHKPKARARETPDSSLARRACEETPDSSLARCGLVRKRPIPRWRVGLVRKRPIPRWRVGLVRSKKCG